MNTRHENSSPNVMVTHGARRQWVDDWVALRQAQPAVIAPLEHAYKKDGPDMAIDSCQFTFDDLAKIKLPRLFAEPEESMKAPIAAKDLVGFKSCTKEALTKIGHSADFRGCYVFFDGTTPEYVGISGAVIKRLIQHLNHRSHFPLHWSTGWPRQSTLTDSDGNRPC